MHYTTVVRFGPMKAISWYIANILVHIQALKDLHKLYQKRVISFRELTLHSISDHPLDAKQKLVVSLVKKMLNKRKDHYESINCALNGFESDDEEDERLFAPSENPVVEGHHDESDELLDWHKFLLVVGRAGTGKSFTLVKVIDTCLSMTGNVFVATPTGFLATHFKDKFPDDIHADTIHAAFHYPVLPQQRPAYNWNLSNHHCH